MANNIFANRTNWVIYSRANAGALRNAPAGGEIDLRSVFTTVNTRAIYSNHDGQLSVFMPDRPAMSSLTRLEPGRLYAVVAKIDFEVQVVAPNPNPTFQSGLLSFLTTATSEISNLLDGRLPNLPTIKRNDAIIAIENASSGQAWIPSALADTLGSFRLWASMEPLATGGFFNTPVASIASWGSSIAGLSQSNESFRPVLTTEGLDVSANPPGWLSYDGSFLASSNFTIFIMERREALNAGYIIGGSSSSNGTNLLAGYASSTSFVFNRMGGNNLAYAVPATLSSNFRIWALRFDGTNRSLWLNGAKVAEVADSTPLSAYTGAALGWAFQPSYIGKIRHYMIAASDLGDAQIPQVTAFLQAYTNLYPTDPPETPEGTISITMPTANAVYAQQADGNAEVLVQGSYTVSEGELTAIEARFASGTWRTIASRPVGGLYSAVLPGVTGTGSLSVRFKGAESVSAAVAGITVVNANPTGLTTLVTGSNITLSWTAPAGVTVTSYSVGIFAVSGTTWIDTNDVVGTSYVFTNLLPDSYQFRVKANLLTSASPWVETTLPTEIAGTPPAQINANLWNGSTSIFRLEDTSWADAKGVNTITPTGAPVIGTALLGSGAGSTVFNGSTYFTVADPLAFRFTDTHSWVFRVANSGSNSSTSRLGTVLVKGIASSNTGSRSYAVLLDSNNQGDRITVQLSNNGTSTTSNVSTPRYTAKAAMHVVIVFRLNNYLRVYVNGALAVEGAAPSVHQPNTRPVRFGSNLDASDVITNPLIGNLQGVKFLGREVNFEEVTYLYNNGVARSVTQP